MWTVDHEGLERLAIGAGILGTGGGGNPYLGKLHAQRLVAGGGVIQVVAPEDVPDEALVTSVGFMGAPVVSVERIKRGDEPMVALRALERHIGRRFTHVVPGEIGGSNSTAPMVAAAMSGLPIIDGDGMGRAFPELQMDTFMIYGVAAAPGAIADPRGHVAIFDGFTDANVLERYARSVTIGMGGSAGYAFPVMSGVELKRTVVAGTITLAIGIGAAVLAARQAKDDAVDAVLGVTGGMRLFNGKIVDVERRLVGGFARGVLKLDGIGGDAGRSLAIDFQNENLIARTNDGETLAVVPDLICIVDQDSAEPITTEVLRYGLRVVVLGIPAPAALKSAQALAVVGPAAFGYPDVPYIPMAGVFGEGLGARG
ncbi:MAG: DUF917 domain-containing protein [Thermomicrobiales bacterium]